MTFLIHCLIVTIYLGGSIALAFALPRLVPAVGQDLAMFAGGALLLLSGMMHQGVTSLRRSRRLSTQLTTLTSANEAIKHELGEALSELRTMRERLPDPNAIVAEAPTDEPPPPADAEGPPAADSARELQLLKTLFAQLPRQGFEVANDTAQAAAATAALGLSTGADERLVVGAGASRSAAVGVATRADASGLSDYRQNFANGRAPAGTSMLDVYTPPDMRGGPIKRDPAGAAVLAATRDALERARVVLFVQPIVSLPNRRVRFYETFSRIRLDDGELIGPERYLRIATEAGLIAAIDNNLLFRCVQLMRRLRRHDRAYGFFCNISPHTLRDETFFPQFIEFLAENAELAGDLVFEFTQTDVEQHYAAVENGLERLARLGYRFSLDRVSRQGLNFRALAQRHFRYVKFDTNLIMELQASPDGPARIDKLASEASAAGISIIIEKIETERDLVELLDHRFSFGQGYLFGSPKESRTR